MSEQAEYLNRLVRVSRFLHGDNAPEFMAGLISTVANEKQIKALVHNLEDDLDVFGLEIEA